MVNKKLIFIIFVLLLFLFLPFTYAEDNYKKYSNNPLLFPTNINGWNEKGKLQPFITFLNNNYYLIYTTFNGYNFKISVATSSAGLSWTSKDILFDYNGRDTHDPSLLQDENNILLVFGSSINGSDYKISKATSIDGENYSNISDILNITNSWEIKGISTPVIFKESDIYYLFYSGWDGSSWKIGLSLSNNGLVFEKCLNNPIISPGDGPFLTHKNNTYYLYYHMPNSPKGIRVVQSTDPLGCNMTWSAPETILTPGPEVYDANHMTGPSVLENNGQLWIYYSGRDNSGNWTLNLATEGDIILPIPTIIPTTTPTPQPTIPSTPKPKIIFAPGMFGSWNKDALIYNKPVNQSDWIINPIAKEMDGIFATLNNLNYQLNNDYFVFAYDWRKPLEDIADDLYYYINSNPKLNQNKIYLIGHCQGGLVERLYLQKYQNPNISKFVIMASPHQGVATAYKLLANGQFDKSDSLMWLGQKILLHINKDSPFEPVNYTLASKLPILYDLLPTYSFLQDRFGNLINIDNIQTKNIALTKFNPYVDQIFNKLQTMSGNKGPTINGYIIKSQSKIDKILGLNPDGVPYYNLYSDGDETVTIKSSQLNSDYKVLPNTDHGQILYTKDSIMSLLDSLDINYQSSDIVAGSKTKITPSLIFSLMSPAKLVISDGINNYQSNDDFVFIADAKKGQYNIKIEGIDSGQYSLLIGQIGNQDDLWTKIYGSTYLGKKESYSFIFNPDDLTYPALNTSQLFDELIIYLQLLNNDIKNNHFSKSISYLKKARFYYHKTNIDATKKYLILTNSKLLKTYKKISDNQSYKVLIVVEKLEILYNIALVSNKSSSKKNLQKQILSVEKKIKNQENVLFKKYQKNVNVTKKALKLNYLTDKLDQTKIALSDNKLNYAEILLFTIKSLLVSF